MELLFVSLGGTLLGLAARYLLPGRTTMGSVLLPAIGTVAAAALWVGLTWLGWQWDAGAIWWVSLGGAAVVSVVASIAISRRRTQGDQRMRDRLMKSSAGSAQTS